MHNSSKNPGWFLRRNAVSLIMGGLILLIGVLLFSDFSQSPVVSSDPIDPYVLSTKGKTLIFRDKLITVNELVEERIFVGDRIKTLDSTATVYWPDGSITRLAERSSIVINEMRAQSANEHIEIDFSLEQGKSWSHVVRYLFDDSYFRERFNDDTALAAVRGTVFEINLDKKYIHTIDHGVSVQDVNAQTGSVFIAAGWVLDTETRKALLSSYIDTAWNKANTDADVIYLNARLEALKQEILNAFGNKSYLSQIRENLGIGSKDALSEALIEGDPEAWDTVKTQFSGSGAQQNLTNLYQKFYALPNDGKVLETKMRLRDLIVESAPADEKKELVSDFARSTLYDIWKESSSVGQENTQKLEKKLDEYVRRGADSSSLDTLMNGVSGSDVQKLNKALEKIKMGILKTLGSKNLMNEVINSVPFEEMNNEATQVRKTWTEVFWKFLTQ